MRQSATSPFPPFYILSRLTPVFILASIFFSVTLSIVLAVSGALDPSFGNGGIVAPVFLGDFLGNRVVIQPDGKIVTAGRDPATGGLFIVLRHNSDGSLDSSFGNDGVVTSSFNSIGGLWGPVGLALQTDGKIVVVGEKAVTPVSGTVAVARYTITGDLDSTFGGNGVVTTTDGFFAIAVAIQPDGKVVIGGSSSQDNQNKFVLVRYTVTGTLDSTFGNNGAVTSPLIEHVLDIALQSNGKIIVAGSTPLGGSSDFALARYTITGSLDSTFGSNGVVTTSISQNDNLDAVVVQPDDKIIAMGDSGNISDYTFALARYHSNGSLDSGFGHSGIVTTSINGYGDGNGITLQADGKIVAVGTGKTITDSYTFALVRYNKDGSLDNSFGGSGIIAIPIRTSASAWDVAIQSDHKIVVVGDSYGSEGRYTLARYLGDELEHQNYLPVILKE